MCTCEAKPKQQKTSTHPWVSLEVGLDLTPHCSTPVAMGKGKGKRKRVFYKPTKKKQLCFLKIFNSFVSFVCVFLVFFERDADVYCFLLSYLSCVVF